MKQLNALTIKMKFFCMGAILYVKHFNSTFISILLINFKLQHHWLTDYSISIGESAFLSMAKAKSSRDQHCTLT